MKEIPRSVIDSFTEEVNALSSSGRQMVENALSRLVPMFADDSGVIPNESIAGFRAAACEVMEVVCGQMADLAAARSAEFYDGVRTLSVGSRLGALAESGREQAATEGAVRALVQSVVDTGSTERFVREMGNRVDYEVKKAAGDCVVYNASKDKLKPRFARVPAGGETCQFCTMLASRGFVYRTARKAGADEHYHPNCDCRIVPGFDGMDVEGYDPETLYDEWRNSDHRDYMNDRARRETAKNYEAYVERLRIKSELYSGNKRIDLASGALNDSNDPTFGRRAAHAKAYYKELRARNKRTEIAAVSGNAGLDEDTVARAFDHLFIAKHDLRGGKKRFDPDYEIAGSWQRLRDGKDVKPHDITLIRHEAYEHELMREGLSYESAHKKAEMLYNYSKELRLFIKDGKGGA